MNMFEDLKENIYVMKERHSQYRNINYKNEPNGNSRAAPSNRVILAVMTAFCMFTVQHCGH